MYLYIHTHTHTHYIPIVTRTGSTIQNWKYFVGTEKLFGSKTGASKEVVVFVVVVVVAVDAAQTQIFRCTCQHVDASCDNFLMIWTEKHRLESSCGFHIIFKPRAKLVDERLNTLRSKPLYDSTKGMLL